MNALHRPLVPNDIPSGVKESSVDEAQLQDEKSETVILDPPSTATDEVMSPLVSTVDNECPSMPPIPPDIPRTQGEEEEAAEPSMALPPSPALGDTPSPSPPGDGGVDGPVSITETEGDNVDKHFELLQMGSGCRKRLLGIIFLDTMCSDDCSYSYVSGFPVGDHVYHSRFIWVEKTPAGQAFHWVQSCFYFAFQIDRNRNTCIG